MSAMIRETAASYRRHALSVEDFRRMGDAGILSEDDRVELIEGELIDMAPIGSKHAGVVTRLARLLMRAVGDAAVVSVQNPLFLPPRSEPQPDILLLKPRADDYVASLPTAADVLLLIEVADTSLSYDRDIKLPLYARHGVAESWLFDIEGRRLEIHRQPGSDGYGKVILPAADVIVAPQALPQAVLALAELWLPLADG